jgi:hypothetical protein
MAFKSFLRSLSRRIADSVKSAANEQGVSPEQYALFGSFDADSDYIYLRLLVARPIDELRLHRDTFQKIREAYPDAPWIAGQMSLVIRQVGSETELFLDESAGAEDDVDITDLLEKTTA